MSLIFLIGMPASGKSYWAKKLAKAYKLHHIDLDRYIEKKEKMRMVKLFRIHKEAGFRVLETIALEEIININPANTIVATGGGTPFFHDNIIKMMMSGGIVIYLKAEMSTLARHYALDPKKRPLFNVPKVIEYVFEGLLKERQEVYEKAHHILAVENLTVANFKKIISNV